MTDAKTPVPFSRTPSPPDETAGITTDRTGNGLITAAPVQASASCTPSGEATRDERTIFTSLQVPGLQVSVR